MPRFNGDDHAQMDDKLRLGARGGARRFAGGGRAGLARPRQGLPTCAAPYRCDTGRAALPAVHGLACHRASRDRRHRGAADAVLVGAPVKFCCGPDRCWRWVAWPYWHSRVGVLLRPTLAERKRPASGGSLGHYRDAAAGLRTGQSIRRIIVCGGSYHFHSRTSTKWPATAAAAAMAGDTRWVRPL